MQVQHPSYRGTLDLGDGSLVDTPDARAALVDALRRSRPGAAAGSLRERTGRVLRISFAWHALAR